MMMERFYSIDAVRCLLQRASVAASRQMAETWGGLLYKLELDDACSP